MRLCYQVLLFVGIILISESVPLTSYSKISSSHVSSINDPGCNVTGYGLYINGLKERDISVPERQEFDRYLAEFKKYSDRVQSGQSLTDRNFDLPVPPQRPPFCNASKTVQYIFDDCKVQNNKLYIRNQFVRELNFNDQDQLRRFDEQLANFSARTRAEYFNSLTTPGYNYLSYRATPSTPQLPEAPSFCTASNRGY
uniref:Pepsin inhibitor-3-like repeated domain-containing protein n=1 Tax=Acrobeloides nanus TaxID=290746 RepID=A0A914DML6_9BILA